MNDSLNDIRQAVILTKYYSFDLGNYTIRELIMKWAKQYPHNWLPLAVTEAIYQGRLKAISIEQILNVWQKKGGVHYSFNYEFIRLIQPDLTCQFNEEQELEDIWASFREKLKSAHNNSYISSRHDNSLTPQVSWLNPTQESQAKLDQFQPLNDHSQCFQKLKSLAINDQA